MHSQTSGADGPIRERRILPLRDDDRRPSVKSLATVDVRQRVNLGKKWLAGELAPAGHIARVLLVSRAALYKQRRVRRPIARPVPPPVVREVASKVRVSPETMPVEDALVAWRVATLPTATASSDPSCAEPATP